MEKRALCTFDNKRILLEDGIHTLAIGHKDVTAHVEEDQIENPGGDALYTEKDARDIGLLWSRRKGAEKRAGIILNEIPEENEEEAVEAGRQMRANMMQTLRQLPDLPDRYNPEEASGPSERRHPPEREESTTKPKYRRIQFPSEAADDELSMDQLDPMELIPDRDVLEARAMVQETTESLVQLDQLFAAVQHPDISESRVDPHHHERASASAPGRSRKRRTNAFVLDEAEEGDERDTQSPSLNMSSQTHAENSTRSNSESDSISNIDADDSFIVDDDCYE